MIFYFFFLDKWTMIPLKVKILQLILKEYQILIEEETIQKNNKSFIYN